MAVADIGKRDFVWTLLSTFLKVGVGVLLYPLVLNTLSPETVAVWTVFNAITVISSMLDFGFDPSFARNVAYIFSGVRHLKKTGFEVLDSALPDDAVDYGLLRTTILAMRRFYSRMALLLFCLLAVGGTAYLLVVLRSYAGDREVVFVAWAVLVGSNSYALYTQYYNSLLLGRGLVHKANKITIVSNVVYLVSASVLLHFVPNILSIVVSQALSVLTIRVLYHRAFFSREMKSRLATASLSDPKAVLDAITPNAVKMGLTVLGSFVINRSSIFIGSIFIPLGDMASFGITQQLIFVVAQVSTLVTRVLNPKLFQWRVEGRVGLIRRTYLSSVAVLAVIFALAAVVIPLGGPWALGLIGSKTALLPVGLTLLYILQVALEANHANASDYLMTKNEIPFFRASLLSAVAVLALLVVFVPVMRLGVLGLILAPMVVQAAYQNWKWPYEVMRELRE